MNRPILFLPQHVLATLKWSLIVLVSLQCGGCETTSNTPLQNIISTEHSETSAEKDLQILLQLLSGTFSNDQQVEAQNIATPETQSEADYSRLHHHRQLIESADLEGTWLFSQINREDGNGSIYRQVYQAFVIDDNEQIVSYNYELTNSPRPMRMPTDEELASLKSSQLRLKLPDGCETRWERMLDQFVGTTDPETCLIDSKYKNEKRRIFATEIVGSSGFWANEGAYRLDGNLAFGLEAPNYYKYLRTF